MHAVLRDRRGPEVFLQCNGFIMLWINTASSTQSQCSVPLLAALTFGALIHTAFASPFNQQGKISSMGLVSLIEVGLLFSSLLLLLFLCTF